MDQSVATIAERRALAVILLLALAAFWPTLLSFPSTWSASYQEHGFFVGALTLWLIWRERHHVVGVAGRGIPDLLPVVGLLSVAWLFAVVMNVRAIHQLLFAVIATVAALVIFGWEARRIILVTSATFLLAIPLWGALVPVLQRATVIASGGATRLAGISAEIGYDYIAISSGTFLVEEGCAGINYLMAALVLGAFYAHFFAKRWQTKLALVALAGAMSIVGNWIRVAVLIFLGEATAMQSPYIQDHLWQGWIIFVLMMTPTYMLARRITRREAARAESPEDGPDDVTTAEENSDARANRDGSGEADGKVDAEQGEALRKRALRTSLVAVIGPVLLLVVGNIPRGDDLDRDPGFLGIADEWSVTERSGGAPPWVPDFTGIDDRTLWTVREGGRSINAARYYFVDQRQGEELIQWNNKVAPDSITTSDRIIGPIGTAHRFVHEAFVRDKRTRRVVWYWYRVAGFDTPFEVKAKLLEILAFFGRASASELVVLDAPCGLDDCTDAIAALRAAMGVPLRLERAGAESSPESGSSRRGR
jgi:EpsI family protein